MAFFSKCVSIHTLIKESMLPASNSTVSLSLCKTSFHLNIVFTVYKVFSGEGTLLQAAQTLTLDTQKDAQPPKQQPMIQICGECHTKNEIKSRDPIRCRDCGDRIMYKKRTKRWWVLMLDETGEFRNVFIYTFAPLCFSIIYNV